MMIAKNIPYNATDKAETIAVGHIFHMMIPKDVPIVQGSTEALIPP